MALDLERGLDQHATWVPGSATANLAGATLCAWARPESFTGGVISCVLQFSVNGIAQNVRVGLVAAGTGVISCRARRDDGDAATSCTGGTLTVGTTYFICGVADFTGSRIDIYVAAAGTSISSAAGSVTGIAGWGTNCANTDSDAGNIGALGDAATGEQFDGIVQEARFYQRTLTLAEVQNVFAGGPGGALPRAWWRMNQISGPAGTIIDMMGNHDATPVNSPVYTANIFNAYAPPTLSAARRNIRTNAIYRM